MPESPDDIRRKIAKYAKAAGIDYMTPLLIRIAELESGLNPDAHNTNGEDSVGVFQLNRASNGFFGSNAPSVEELKNSDTNIQIAVNRIAQSINAGSSIEGAVANWSVASQALADMENPLFAGATATAASAPSPGAVAWDAAAAALSSTIPGVTPSGALAGTSLTGMTKEALRAQLTQSFNDLDQLQKAVADAEAVSLPFAIYNERGRLTGYHTNTPEAKAANDRLRQATVALTAADSKHNRLLEMYQIAGSATEYFDQNIAAIIKLFELGEMPADRAFKEIQLTQQARRDQLNEIKADLDTSAANDARGRQQVQDEMDAWEKYTGGKLSAAREAARLYEQIAPRLVSSGTPMNMSSATDQLLRQRGIDPGAPNMITPTPVNIPDVQGSQQAFLDALMNPPARVQALMSGTSPAPVPYPMPSASLGAMPSTPQLPANQYTDLLTQTLLQYIGRPQPGVAPPAPAGIPDWAMGPSIPPTMPLPGEMR